MGDGNVRWYASLLSLMFVWDGVGGVGDGNVRVVTSACCP